MITKLSAVLIFRSAIFASLLVMSGCSYYSKNYYYAAPYEIDGWSEKFTIGRDGGSKGMHTPDEALYTANIGNCIIRLESSYEIFSMFGLMMIPMFPSGYVDSKTSDVRINLELDGESCLSLVEKLSIYVNDRKVSFTSCVTHQSENIRLDINTGVNVVGATSLKIDFQRDNFNPLILRKVKGQSFIVVATL